jgi:hypothetical protein
MNKRLFALLTSLFSLSSIASFGQRQELSVSPVGLIYPKNQLVQYERYVGLRHSLTASLSYNGDGRLSRFFDPPRTERFSATRGAIGYRYYFHSVFDNGGLMLFGSVQAIVDYSALQLERDARYAIPADSLRAAGFSLGPELLAGGKVTISKRVTVSRAIGMQHLFKLFSTNQITQNRDYWADFYWTNDQQDWQFKRNVVTNFRQGWYPSLLVTVGVVLGKQTQPTTTR